MKPMSKAVISVLKKLYLLTVVTGVFVLLGVLISHKEFELVLVVFSAVLVMFISFFALFRQEEASPDVKENSILCILETNLPALSFQISRIMDMELVHNGKNVRCYGVLRMDIEARFVINLKKVRVIRDIAAKTIYLINAEPKYMGCTRGRTDWALAQILEENSIAGSKKTTWKTSKRLENVLLYRQDEFTADIEREIDEKGPVELKALENMLKHCVENAMKSVACNYGGYAILFDSEKSGKSVTLEEFAGIRF